MCSVFDSESATRTFGDTVDFTHSLVFAALMAGVVVVLFRHGIAGMQSLVLWIYFFLVTASHGFLDAMTDGGLGVAFFSPFDNRRFFLPWTPVRVSPIGVSRFFSARGLAVLQSEVLWIWLPAILLAVAALMVRGQQTKSTHD
jgi:inner membrane protein